MIPQYLRLDQLEPTPLSRKTIQPLVCSAMERYVPMVRNEYGASLRSMDDLIETSLNDHNILLINGDYLFAYYLGAEWFSTQDTLMEEYLMRIGEGTMTLTEVFDAIRLMVLLHGAKEAQLGPRESPALKRLYARHGAVETTTTMRIT